VVLLPSLARDSDDYDEVAEGLAAAGFSVLRPKPRGIGNSKGPMTGITLHDFARDIAETVKAHGGGKAVVTLDDQAIPSPEEQRDPTDLIAIDEALKKLEKIDPRKGRVVTLRYFAGLSVEETAAAMDLSSATVKNEWAFARAWLHRELSGEAVNTV